MIHRSRLATVCAALNAEGAAYVLFGGYALQLWGSSRSTRDVDILIEPTVENARRTLTALEHLGHVLVRDLIAEEIIKHPITVIGDIPRVDLLTIAWSVRYPEAARNARIFEVEGVPIPAASLDHLIDSKRTGRLQDAADIEVLEEIRARAG